MNCKPGDLAIVVMSLAGNEGKIVRCIRLVPGGKRWKEFGLCDTWETDTMLPNIAGYENNLMRDAQLRPIRDNDGEDETLQWAPVPVKEIA